MALKLMYITNSETVARIAEDSGVDWIFIDLEVNGKEERQAHLDTVISHHSLDDVGRIRKALSKSSLLVRVNPIWGGSEEEIKRVIDDGADIVMLPYFRSKGEVDRFAELVGEKAKTCLLLETPEAVNQIDSILEGSRFDMIHIGLNDLHIGYGLKFMFELLANGTVEMLCRKFRKRGIPYGFGGIGRIGEGLVPAQMIIAEHYRLGSQMAILSRSFFDMNRLSDMRQIREAFRTGVAGMREFETALSLRPRDFFDDNRRMVCRMVDELVGVHHGRDRGAQL